MLGDRIVIACRLGQSSRMSRHAVACLVVVLAACGGNSVTAPRINGGDSGTKGGDATPGGRDATGPMDRDGGPMPPSDGGGPHDGDMMGSDATGPSDADATTNGDADMDMDAIVAMDAKPRPDASPLPGSPLNAACTGDSDCASSVCFLIDSTNGSRCVLSCGSTADCPAGFACYDDDNGKVCLSETIFTSGPHSAQDGASCTANTDCRSDFCFGSHCTEVCEQNDDCGSTATCVWHPAGQVLYVEACVGPTGSSTLSPAGAHCMAGGNCRSGVCTPRGICADVCASTGQCPGGFACTPLDYTVCLFPLGSDCIEWDPYFVKACVTSTAIGSGAIGDPCTVNTQCRSTLCDRAAGGCTDTCEHDADCPLTHVCGTNPYLTLSDGQQISLNVCKPIGL
jgi:hypothetical protein